MTRRLSGWEGRQSSPVDCLEMANKTGQLCVDHSLSSQLLQERDHPLAQAGILPEKFQISVDHTDEEISRIAIALGERIALKDVDRSGNQLLEADPLPDHDPEIFNSELF